MPRQYTTEEIRSRRERNILKTEGWGAEPTWHGFQLDQVDYQSKIGNALSWYSAKANKDKCKSWLIAYLESIGFEGLHRIHRFPVKSFSSGDAKSCSFLARMKMRGCDLPGKYEAKIKQFAEGLLLLQPEVEKPKVIVRKKKFVDPKINELYGVINETIEDFVVKRSGILRVKLAERANAIEATKDHARLAIDRFKGLYQEMTLALTPADQLQGDENQVQEGYGFLAKEEKQALKMFIEGLYLEVAKVKKDAPVSKGSGRKSIEKPKRGMQFLARHVIPGTRLAVESIDPNEILGVQQLWTYNTKYRQLGVYVAKDFSGLSVSGTRILNFEPQKSLMKRLRHPKLTLPKFMKVVNKGLDECFKDIVSAPQMIKMTVTKETVLLRVCK